MKIPSEFDDANRAQKKLGKDSVDAAKGRMLRAMENKEMLACYTVVNEIYAPLVARIMELESKNQD